MISTDIWLKDGDLEETGALRHGRSEYRLTRPIHYDVGQPGSGMSVQVPAGYVTDLYSLPGRILQRWQPDTARWALPAILHDWLYDVGRVGRESADRILLEAMRQLGVRPLQRLAVWSGVRLGGWRGYGRPEPVNYLLVEAARNQAAHRQIATQIPLMELINDPASTRFGV